MPPDGLLVEEVLLWRAANHPGLDLWAARLLKQPANRSWNKSSWRRFGLHLLCVCVCVCVFTVTHPLTVLSAVGEHLLQGPDRQRLLQHKGADAQVWGNILQRHT